MIHPGQVPRGGPITRLAGWFCNRRVLRRLLLGLAWLVTLIALFYTEENWRGKRAWDRYRSALEARGEQLDLRAFIPEAVPEEQNFAATPLVDYWFTHRTNSYLFQEDPFSRVRADDPARAGRTRAAERHFIDLAAWDKALTAAATGQSIHLPEDGREEPAARRQAAAGVLRGLKPDEAALAELLRASQRPGCRYPVFYDLDNPWGIFLPHLARLKAASLRLQLRACASLAAGQTEDALADVKLMLYLAHSLKTEPFLVSFLIRIDCAQLAAQPIWEGLAEHRWSDPQLAELQPLLLQNNFFAAVRRCLDAERAAGSLTAELLWRKKYTLSNLIDEPGSRTMEAAVIDLFGPLAPRGWYHQEQLTYCRFYEKQATGMFDVKKRRVYPQEVALRAHELERLVSESRWGKTLGGVLHHRLLAIMLLPSLEKLPRKAAITQTASELPALACALERFHLANREFPASLEELVPRFLPALPSDPLTGHSYLYRRNGDGRYTIYSVGWNEKDDGGAPGPTLYDERSGDWVWEYPRL